MKKENQLEKDMKKFDWKEWTPLIGLYFVPRNIFKGEDSLPSNLDVLNAIYHGLVNVTLINYLFG